MAIVAVRVMQEKGGLFSSSVKRLAFTRFVAVDKLEATFSELHF
jgi:hypothetical protein